MFVDACAIVAMFMEEDSKPAYEASLLAAVEPFTSPLAAWEAIMVLAHPTRLDISLSQAHRDVVEWLGRSGVALRDTGQPQTVLAHAVSVAETHGIGKRALSNFDCFHYAHAKAAGAPLLTLDRLLRETDIETLPADA